jgi:hypothetical protein
MVNTLSTSGPHPFLAQLADFRKIRPASRQNLNSVEDVMHAVIARSPADEHIGHRITSFPPDHGTGRPPSIKDTAVPDRDGLTGAARVTAI